MNNEAFKIAVKQTSREVGFALLCAITVCTIGFLITALPFWATVMIIIVVAVSLLARYNYQNAKHRIQ